MRHYARLITLAAATVIVLAAAVGSASAGHLSVSNQNIRVTWSALEFAAGGTAIRCGLTLEGSFHSRTITKVEKTLIGYITTAISQRPCTNGAIYVYSKMESVEMFGSVPVKLP